MAPSDNGPSGQRSWNISQARRNDLVSISLWKNMYNCASFTWSYFLFVKWFFLFICIVFIGNTSLYLIVLVMSIISSYCLRKEVSLRTGFILQGTKQRQNIYKYIFCLLRYESAKLLHARIKPLKGKAFENMFVHYMPRSLNWYNQDMT